VPGKVLYVAWAPFFSGAEQALLVLIDHLDRTRHEPVVAVGSDGELPALLADRGVPVFRINIRHTDLRNPIAWGASVFAIARIARREKVALIHANEGPSFQPAGYAARLLGLPSVAHFRFPEGRAATLWRLKPGFTRAMFVSSYLRAHFEHECPGVFDGRADVVYDGVALPNLPSPDERQAIRRSLGIEDNEAAVVFAGQIAEVKGIWELVEAARALVDGGVRARFIVIGDDLRNNSALRYEMEQRVAARGLARSFRFLGFRRDVPQLLPAFDVSVVPSHVEPLGNATLEAMAAGLPVVGSRVGGIPEMIVDGETGLLVPSRHSAALATGIQTFAENQDLRRRFGAAGRVRASQAFSPVAHAKQVQGLYRAVLGSRDLER